MDIPLHVSNFPDEVVARKEELEVEKVYSKKKRKDQKPPNPHSFSQLFSKSEF